MIQEALSKGKQLSDRFDFWSTKSTLKSAYLKYVPQTNNRVKNVLHAARIETEPEDFDTKLPVDVIVETFEKGKALSKQSFTTVKIETTWLDHHTKEYQSSTNPSQVMAAAHQLWRISESLKYSYGCT